MNQRVPGRLVITGAALLLTACQTPYQADRWYRDGGYREQKTGAASWQVTFTGNENTDMERVMDLSLLRAAELCQQDGYAFVTVQATNSVLDVTEEEEIEYAEDEDGNEVEAGASTYTVTSPRVVRQVECAHAIVDGHRDSFDARYLARSITAKYGL